MTEHTTLRLSDAELRRLSELALWFGYVRVVNGIKIPNWSGLIRAIANEELIIVRAKQAEPQEVEA